MMQQLWVGSTRVLSLQFYRWCSRKARRDKVRSLRYTRFYRNRTYQTTCFVFGSDHKGYFDAGLQPRSLRYTRAYRNRTYQTTCFVFGSDHKGYFDAGLQPRSLRYTRVYRNQTYQTTWLRVW
ncbi:hypothetical protein J6590_064229 [Homalodisca vitripennis]|nr:hypothetical protein J6590_064229 [Homalodisca vitripennis]